MLKKELHHIIDNHKKLSYNALWEALRDTDEDPQIIEIMLFCYIQGAHRGKIRMDLM